MEETRIMNLCSLCHSRTYNLEAC